MMKQFCLLFKKSFISLILTQTPGMWDFFLDSAISNLLSYVMALEYTSCPLFYFPFALLYNNFLRNT